MKIPILCFCVLFLNLVYSFSFAQKTVLSSGNDIIDSGGSISFSLGQVAYTFHNGKNETELQGVQQPFEISVLTEVFSYPAFELNIEVYPNPVKDYLILKTSDNNGNILVYRLFDNSGKMLKSSEIEGNEALIRMNQYAKSMYFLKVYIKPGGNMINSGHYSNSIATYKIVKF